MRLIALLLALLVSAPAAAAPYTEIPPFDATEFARQHGVFRWYRGCWWQVKDPNVYLLCNSDKTVYIILPDGTLRQILREDAEKNGLDDSGARHFFPIRNANDARGEGIDLPYGATAYERYRTLPVSYPIRPSWSTVGTSYPTRPPSYGSTSTRTASAGDQRRTSSVSRTSGISRTYGNVSGTPYGGSAEGTGVYRSDATTGGRYVSVGTSGTSTSGSSRVQEILNRGNSDTYVPSSRVQEILNRDRSSSYVSSGRVQEILSRGRGNTTPDPDSPLNRPLHIACSSIDDYGEGYLFGPIPCTWYPGVFGPVPRY